MAIQKRRITASSQRTPARRPVTASRSMAPRRPMARPRSISTGAPITASVRARGAKPQSVTASAAMAKLTPAQKVFASQLMKNTRRAVMGATNTSNIMVKPEFTQLLPLFVQKLLLPDVMGTVAMNSRQQLIPYYKFIAENTKGETSKGDVISSAFVNKQGIDPNFTGRVVRNEVVESSTLAYTPILPGSVTISDGTDKYYDNGAEDIIKVSDGSKVGSINYALGTITGITGDLSASYEYDNETVGPDQNGEYGAKMAKGYFQLDEINLVAQAHELACYWSIYSAFATSTEWGSNLQDMAKESAIAELTAEINSAGFKALADAAAYKPQFNWDASPIQGGAVNPQGYLNMFMLKINQAANSIYQATRTVRPNRLITGTSASTFFGMLDGFQAADIDDTVGPYKYGKINEFEIFVDPNMDTNKWVMTARNEDIRKCAGIFAEYMPIVSTDAIGLANASVQQGYASMYDIKIVNPDLVVSGKILGQF